MKSRETLIKPTGDSNTSDVTMFSKIHFRVTGGELFDDIVAREFYSEADARWITLEILLFPLYFKIYLYQCFQCQ